MSRRSCFSWNAPALPSSCYTLRSPLTPPLLAPAVRTKALARLWQRASSYRTTHWVGSLLHWQFLHLGAFVVIIMVADV